MGVLEPTFAYYAHPDLRNGLWRAIPDWRGWLQHCRKTKNRHKAEVNHLMIMSNLSLSCSLYIICNNQKKKHTFFHHKKQKNTPPFGAFCMYVNHPRTNQPRDRPYSGWPKGPFESRDGGPGLSTERMDGWLRQRSPGLKGGVSRTTLVSYMPKHLLNLKGLCAVRDYERFPKIYILTIYVAIRQLDKQSI